MSVMTAPQFVLPADRPLTVADLDLTPDDGCRYELDDGVLVVPDPDEPSLTAYTLTGDTYAEVGRAAGEQRFAPAIPFPVEIVPAALVTAHWRH